MKRQWVWVTLSILAVLAICPALVVVADDSPPGLKMEAAAAFDGNFKYGEWLPVWVQLENSGPDLDVEVRVRVAGSWGATTFAAPVSLPTGSRKRVPVYVLPNNFTRALEVRLVEGNDLLVSQEIPVKPQPNINYLVGLVTSRRGALSLILGASRPNRDRTQVLLDLSLADLPERSEGLYSLDCLVLNDVDTSMLTPDQRSALDAWVRHGGRLVIGGGAGAARTVAGLPESLLPLALRGEVEVDALPGMADFVGGETVRVPGPFVVATGESDGGRTLAAQDDLPLVRERAVGSGYVDFVALDLATSPFDAWTGTMAFWERLILDNADYPPGLPPDVSIRQMRSDQMSYALIELPSLALPSVKGLTLLLGSYVVLVGPANYLVLRWRKRLHWAWVTIPLITIAFSAGAFGVGYAMRGTDLIVNKIAIVAMQPDGTATVNTYLGLFSPSQQSYEIEVQSDGLLSPLNAEYSRFGSAGATEPGETVFVQGNPARVRGLSVNQWSMQTFMTEGRWNGIGRITGDIRLEDRALVGTVRNGTNLSLKDVVVVLGNEFVRLGDLSPGESADVRLELPGQVGRAFGPPLSYRLFEEQFRQAGPSRPPREAQLKQRVLDSVFVSRGKFDPTSSIAPGGVGASFQGLMLFGWFDQAPPDVRVAGREPAQQTTALLYVPLSYHIADEGPLSVPPGLIPGALVQMPREGGPCGPPGTTAVFIGRGEALFEFRLPEHLWDGRVEKLVLFIGSDGGWQQVPDTAIYDWEAEGWVELDDPGVGNNVIPDVGGLVAKDGLVRVRTSSEGNQGGCFSLELGFEGAQ